MQGDDLADALAPIDDVAFAAQVAAQALAEDTVVFKQQQSHHASRGKNAADKGATGQCAPLRSAKRSAARAVGAPDRSEGSPRFLRRGEVGCGAASVEGFMIGQAPPIVVPAREANLNLRPIAWAGVTCADRPTVGPSALIQFGFDHASESGVRTRSLFRHASSLVHSRRSK
ncbi:MAG: hypothetical protein Fur0014_06880 [Rubrivivax sp.]